MRNDNNFRCRVCGYKSESPPWGADGHTPLYDFCPCCGVEHGYQDATLAGARKFRTAWISSGAAWDMPSAKPDGWILDEQLSNVPKEFQ
jgi:hypothetical protein